MTNKKATPAIQLRLEVIRFGSADVIATSAVFPLYMLQSDQHEMIANFTRTYGGDSHSTAPGYSEPTNQ